MIKIFIVICILGLMGCSTKPHEPSEVSKRRLSAEKKSVEKCLELNGMPKFSHWDDRFTDCIFMEEK